MTTPSAIAAPAAALSDTSLADDARALHRVLDELTRVVQFRDRDRICCHDVSVTQCYALRALVAEGPMGLNALAESLFLDKSTASRVVAALERKGYLLRRPDPADGRAVVLEASDGGRRLYRRIEEELVEEVTRLAAGFGPAVRREMVRLLGRLAAAAAARVERSGGCCRLG
jgi:MarR family transcriptional regulator, 2-MHQ and catechol-resistance regulon repressor